MRAGARERLLSTASELFYRHGINNVGIDLVLARSGVAKASLYHHFKSKDELVLAFLEKMDAEWSAWLRSRVEASKASGRLKPLAVFDALGEWFATETFRGCPFISTAAEVHDPGSPIHRAAWQFKQGLRRYLLELLEESGRPDPALADQLLLLADGAIVRAALENRPEAAATARQAAAALLR